MRGVREQEGWWWREVVGWNMGKSAEGRRWFFTFLITNGAGA